MLESILNNFELIDYLAFGWFVFCCGGYSIYADNLMFRKSIHYSMGRYRSRWVLQLLKRPVRNMDVAIISTHLTSLSFLASTTIFVLGGVIATLSLQAEVIEKFLDLPYVTKTGVIVFQFKLLLLLAIFMYAFFKFIWALRLASYSAIILGAVPPADYLVTTQAYRSAFLVGRMNMRLNLHYNQGLRAYFFALSILPWFVHPIIYFFVLTWIILVMYRREFRSISLKSIKKF